MLPYLYEGEGSKPKGNASSNEHLDLQASFPAARAPQVLVKETINFAQFVSGHGFTVGWKMEVLYQMCLSSDIVIHSIHKAGTKSGHEGRVGLGQISRTYATPRVPKLTPSHTILMQP